MRVNCRIISTNLFFPFLFLSPFFSSFVSIFLFPSFYQTRNPRYLNFRKLGLKRWLRLMMLFPIFPLFPGHLVPSIRPGCIRPCNSRSCYCRCCRVPICRCLGHACCSRYRFPIITLLPAPPLPFPKFDASFLVAPERSHFIQRTKHIVRPIGELMAERAILPFRRVRIFFCLVPKGRESLPMRYRGSKQPAVMRV